MGLSPDAKERLGVVFEVTKTIFHWGFIPAVIYLGKILTLVFNKQNVVLGVGLFLRLTTFMNYRSLEINSLINISSCCRVQERS